ncbi:uncharacterized protein LOC133532797 [Cydia pomonella]|uniref:uncharacterized protein LOC133532797 n=1 Tax=Cydia pomonella TaxID=82600 RepID=UPI002ADD771C|nr:uncharacterized protein LOC133532797 [Cydia pomonella]
MAFSLRKMLSNINYFGKPGDTGYEEAKRAQKHFGETSEGIDFERTEPDSTSRYATSLKLPESVKNFAAKKSSLSDTDILNVPETPVSKKAKRKCKKLKVDVDARISDSQENSDDTPSENTPKHVHLEVKSADIFKDFDFNKSFDFGLSDDDSDDNGDIQSLSDHSDSDGSITSREKVKMCRKVQPMQEEQLARSTSLESFGDVELDKNEEERISLLVNYQNKLEKIDYFMKKLLSDFQFNIEVSKIFHCRSLVPTVLGGEVKQPKMLDAAFVDSRAPSPSGPWNVIVEKEDVITKQKFKKQLMSVKHTIDEFVNCYLNESKERKPFTTKLRSKKKMRHFDFPDLREAMVNLFGTEEQNTDLCDSKCICNCHSQSESDSGLTSKSDERSLSNQSITSSIGNFSLDSSTLTAYSESLDQIVSYCSFQDTSLYSDLLQIPAIERITFYVQVHSVQLKCEATNQDFECKNVIKFYCPTCKITETDENSLLRHILSQTHCEKIHFQYKTAYIKKCVAAGKEIQPSTVLNPMTMYRDVNKIVCFGDAVYACSLCFENPIAGESILMAHILEPEHIERREKLDEIIE